MNRQLTALFAALEALLVVGIGIGVPLVPLTLMWAIQYGLQLDWTLFWRASVDVWLLGHGTDLRFALDPVIAESTGLPGATDSFLVTIAPLGFALVTALLGVRAGRRIGETPHRLLGLAVAIGVFGALALGATLTASIPLARPSIWQGILLPTLVFALGLGIGSEVSRMRPGAADVARRRIRNWLDDRVPGLMPAVRIAVLGGTAVVAMVLAVSAVAVAALLALSYGQVIALYEGVQSGVLGGAALTIAQVALLPNVVIWGASWFVGPGFAIGTGSAVSPLGTTLGPLPAVPILGAVPTGDMAYGFVGLLVPVLAACVVGLLLKPRLASVGLDSPMGMVAVGIGTGIAGGMLLGALAWSSSGSVGPGRLADVGPPWLLVGLWAALEIAVPATVALFVAGAGAANGGRQGRASGDGEAERKAARMTPAQRERMRDAARMTPAEAARSLAPVDPS